MKARVTHSFIAHYEPANGPREFYVGQEIEGPLAYQAVEQHNLAEWVEAPTTQELGALTSNPPPPNVFQPFD